LEAAVSAGSIINRAAELVGGDRQRTHGDKLPNHENIARLWNAYLLNKKNYTVGLPLSALDVAHMMALLKIARTQLGEFNPDNYVDLAGYAGVAGEIAERSHVRGKADGDAADRRVPSSGQGRGR
jgi:hypothetical protein